jgi:uncharacterized protein
MAPESEDFHSIVQTPAGTAFAAIGGLARQVFCERAHSDRLIIATDERRLFGNLTVHKRVTEGAVMGHIIRWKEDGDFDGKGFAWNDLLLACDPANDDLETRGNILGDAFGSPDAIAFDPSGMLWVGTDVGSCSIGQGPNGHLGSHSLLCCNPATCEVGRFLTGPVGCELTGATWTPGGRVLFINVQHPGESPHERSDPGAHSRFSNRPDKLPGDRPLSATVAIWLPDGGVIGA